MCGYIFITLAFVRIVRPYPSLEWQLLSTCETANSYNILNVKSDSVSKKCCITGMQGKIHYGTIQSA